MKVSNTLIWVILAQLTIYTLVLGSYVIYVADVYYYFGEMPNSPNLSKIGVATIATVFFVMCVGSSCVPSVVVLQCILSLSIIPNLVVWSCSNLSTQFAVLVCLAFALAATITRCISIPRITFPRLARGSLIIILSGTAIFATSMAFILGGYSYINLDWSQMYALRATASNNLNPIFGYIVPTLSYAIIPLAFALSLQKHQWHTALLLALCSIMLGAITNQKAPMLIPFITAFFFAAFRRRSAILCVLAGLILVLLIGNIDFSVASMEASHTPWIGAVGIWRALVIPAQLNYFYWDFFMANEPILWSQSKITLGLIDDPYKGVRMVNLIGTEYYNNPNLTANTGWIGSGMANAREVGVLVYGIMIGILLQLIDKIALTVGNSIAGSVFAVPIILIVTTADLPTVLLTCGLALLIGLSLVTGSVRGGGSVLPQE